jgi:hypothetical protein
MASPMLRIQNVGSTNGCPGIKRDAMVGTRIFRKTIVIPNKTDEHTEQAIVNIRKALMDGYEVCV